MVRWMGLSQPATPQSHKHKPTSSICVANIPDSASTKSSFFSPQHSLSSLSLSHTHTVTQASQFGDRRAAAMANMIMASSCNSLIRVSSSTPPPASSTRLPIVHISLPRISTPKLFSLPKPQQIISSATLKSLSVLAATSLAFAPPSLAEEFEKAALFDFNLTLPIIMAEFLLLMFALDKVYFTPLGKFMDERDSAIREKLNSVKDTSEEVKQLEEQATAIMKAARAEISAALNQMKKDTQAEVEQKIAEGRKKVEAELQEALASLEKQKDETIKSLDSQITNLSQEIVKKVLPTA